jgi:hypothetical protein
VTAYIENPRHTPRIPIQCGARIALRSGTYFVSCTVDVGPGGCGVLAAPSPLPTGERAFLEIEHAGTAHLFAGRIAWASSTPPWRGGVAFDAGSLGAAAALFARIAAAHGSRGSLGA